MVKRCRICCFDKCLLSLVPKRNYL